jgi:hypothetical protein
MSAIEVIVLQKHILKLLVGPGVVPQHSDFNNLNCQTALSAITGAKGILPRCKTRTVTISYESAVRYVRIMSAIPPIATIRRHAWNVR